MTPHELLAIILVALGASSLSAAIFITLNRYKNVPTDLQDRWLLLTGLMFFFFAAYLAFLYIQIKRIVFPLELLASLVFFGGACFTLIVLQLSLETIHRMKDSKDLLVANNLKLRKENQARIDTEDKLQKSYDLLESRVQARTAELTETNAQLQAEISERKEIEKKLNNLYAETRELAKHLARKNIELEQQHNELEQIHAALKSSQNQLLQREKMASIGQLAAVIAHEINNPMGFISSNLHTLRKYMEKLVGFINAHSGSLTPEELETLRQQNKIDYILADVNTLIEESREGAEEVKEIVNNLKNFSRVDEAELKEADINACLESTIKVLWNELKHKATIAKEFGELPLIKCYPQELNQAFMNLLINAAQAIESPGEITIKTWRAEESIRVTIADTGHGIAAENLGRLFEPFFTTKEVGTGTGLGLSTAYDTIKKHQGEINVESQAGQGTTFTIKIPIISYPEGTDRVAG